MEKIDLVLCTSAKEVYDFYNEELECLAEELDEDFEGFTHDLYNMDTGETYTDEILPLIEQQDFWGFASLRENKIYLWRGTATRGELIRFFAHELSHILLDPFEENADLLDNHIRVERRSIIVEEITNLAFRFAEELYE